MSMGVEGTGGGGGEYVLELLFWFMPKMSRMFALIASKISPRILGWSNRWV